MKRVFSSPLLHPLLFSTYPLIALASWNINEADPLTGVRPLLLSLSLALLLLLLIWLATKRLSTASVLTSFLLLPLLSYGHFYVELKLLPFFDSTIVRHRFLLPVLFLAMALGVLFLLRSSIKGPVHSILNTIAIVMVSLPLLRGTASYVNGVVAQPRSQPAAESCALEIPEGERPPDIYLIIMDAYERDNVLWELHGYDNSWFLDELKREGFYIAEGSLSNYRFTVLSLATLLNMDYIQSFADRYNPDSNSRWAIAQMIRDNRVRRELSCIGYQIVSIDSGVTWTNWPDSDYYFSPDSDPFHSMHLVGQASRLESLYLETTVLRAYFDLLRQSGNKIPEGLDPGVEHRRRILFSFDQMQSVPQLPSPKLVYAHIVSPHPPMVFGQGADIPINATFEEQFGGEADELNALVAYSRQVDYLNHLLLETVETILEESESPPIIIIQADHGWAERNPEDKVSILNALYLPQGKSSQLYPTITPVNTFRLVFDAYLGGDFGLLEDQSYISRLESLYDFKAVENTWKSDGN